VRATGLSCRTNLAPFTAFRGFGGPQGMFVMETAIDAAARAMNVPAHELQRRNLLREDSVFPYGMRAERCRAERCWDEADARYDLAARVAAAEAHNAASVATKKGVAAMPVCFGISFTNTSMNQAGALVHVYTDGSVGVSTAAVEMGQGVNQKIRRIVALTLGIDVDRVRLETTNTTRVANTSPTAASSGADMNGAAAKLACEQILARLRAFDRDEQDWDRLVAAAYLARIDLSAHAFYATPGIHFDKATEKGRPFAYHVYGTAFVEVTLDVLRGTAELDAVRLVHDGGNLLDEAVDRGQVEGALAQGLGWMLLEEARWDQDGHLLHDTAGKYKVPDLGFLPDTVEVAFLEDAANPEAVLGSKAVGEPPLMYGIGAFFALRNAIAAAGAAIDASRAEAPLTAERTMELLTGGFRPVAQARP
jgi:xanthine dehydrogenase large subunit